VATLALCCYGAFAAENRDVVAPVALGDVSVLGAPGALFQASLDARVFSAKARGEIYDDAVNAFETHYDEKHLTWQNEYWGKTMLCVAGAVEYTQDPDLNAANLRLI
jgi:hypothetical protein